MLYHILSRISFPAGLNYKQSKSLARAIHSPCLFLRTCHIELSPTDFVIPCQTIYKVYKYFVSYIAGCLLKLTINLYLFVLGSLDAGNSLEGMSLSKILSHATARFSFAVPWSSLGTAAEVSLVALIHQENQFAYAFWVSRASSYRCYLGQSLYYRSCSWEDHN